MFDLLFVSPPFKGGGAKDRERAGVVILKNLEK